MVRDDIISLNVIVSSIPLLRFHPLACHVYAHPQPIQGPAHPPWVLRLLHSIVGDIVGLPALEPLLGAFASSLCIAVWAILFWNASLLVTGGFAYML